MAGLFALAAALLIGFFMQRNQAQTEAQTYMDVLDEYTIIQYEETPESTPGAPAETEPETANETQALPRVVPDYTRLREINPDTVGWIAIPDSTINYPVMQAGDNTLYLKRDTTGSKSSAGAAFIDCANSIDRLDQNTVIYAHNMGVGRETEMFGPLLRYKEQAYCESHRFIQFDTHLEPYGWWEVFSVLSVDLRESGFNYLCQGFEDATAFESWLANAQARSLHDMGVAVSASDHILTLSTCDRSSYGQNGRFVVMAVLRGAMDIHS